MVRRELLVATSTFFMCVLLFQTGDSIQLRGIGLPGLAWRSVVCWHPATCDSVYSRESLADAADDPVQHEPIT